MIIEIIDNKELPNYADFLELIIGSLGIIATAITLYMLMRKDKERASEIQSLSSIALQLTNMMQLNQTSYLESIVPHMKVIYYKEGYHFLKFTNTNKNCRITNYYEAEPKGKKGNLVTQISDSGNKQEFSFSIELKKEKLFNIDLTYEVNDKYLYSQRTNVYLKYDKYYAQTSKLIFLGNK